MRSRIIIILLCIIFIVSLPCLASGTADTDGGLIRVRGGTVLYNDADLTKAIGILPADACVYSGETLGSTAGDIIEILYLKDFIVRYAYIPLSTAEPLTPAEKAAYAADSSDGILIRPGISLMNIELSPLPADPGSSVFPDPSPVPEYTEEAGDPPVDPVSSPETDPAFPPAFHAKAAEEPGAGDPTQMAGSIVRLPSGTPLYADAGLSDIMGWLTRDAFVYVNADLTVSGASVIEIVFCRDYIIRYAYVSPSAAVIFDDLGDEDTPGEDGITFKPGVILSNASLADVPPDSGASSEPGALDPVSALQADAETVLLPESFTASDSPAETAAPADAVSVISGKESGSAVPDKDPDEKPAVPSLPSDESSVSAETAQPAADPDEPENAAPSTRAEGVSVVSHYAGIRPKAVPTGKHYLLNADDPVPAGSMIRSVILYPMSTGRADGTVSVLYLTDGKYRVAFSKDFSLTVPYGEPWETVISLDTVCEKDAFVTVYFSASGTARFSMAADGTGFLRCFANIDDDPVMLTTEGYTVNYSIGFD